MKQAHEQLQKAGCDRAMVDKIMGNDVTEATDNLRASVVKLARSLWHLNTHPENRDDLARLTTRPIRLKDLDETAERLTSYASEVIVVFKEAERAQYASETDRHAADRLPVPAMDR